MNKQHRINENPSLTHHQLLNAVCTPLKTLGINFFGYTAVDLEGNAFCLGSKPDYAAEYLRRDHARNDVHCHSEKANKQFRYDFWDYLEMTKNNKALYQMAAAFNQGHTLTITKHDDDMTHCYHFSGKLTDSEINQRYLEKMDSLHAFIHYFNDCMKNIPELAAVYQLPVNIDETAKQQKKINIVSDDPREIDLDTEAKSRLYFKHETRYYLTQKERECLQWLRLGKSAALIAEINKVSRKTIERYVESIKAKYNCYTMFQLGERIATSGLSTFLNLQDSRTA
ncbi:helix-turn-helix transcriptional regulator [Legionella micdadei]|uniref:DNA-binding transcriptional regulator, CsgD family n=1 Tax=Legionella micdadei TaxID=451 RepID=A0A098GGB7_LEGMI|nr:helix-turn-helix transcriptional regulator [Legionella micdadei]ARG97865.1 helix-turn-helix transcriptional regulator [Legionella micdadei]ARG99817.1 helix-turn-helix transcriptional regulator [Legionella micdadei]KTD28581.1 putative transcriptional regulator [Legionella micdadei]NSL19174.1 helix-turn-helix transcriptional regulator [Legionella micdadei]CEG60526.1 Putative transcriptional regulator [Legionella micdadei]